MKMATATQAKIKRIASNGKAPNGKAPAKQPVVTRRVARPSTPQPMRWTSEQYHRMTELGWFEDRRVELIGGEIIEMAAMNGPHFTGVWVTQKALLKVFKKGYLVPAQLPLRLPDGSEPLPDIMVIEGNDHDFEDALPTTALLVVEISDSSVTIDRDRKASLYAAAGIPEYWINNLPARQLEVQRQPIEQTEQPFGAAYAEKFVLTEKDTVTPLAAPGAKIAVKSLLPRKK